MRATGIIALVILLLTQPHVASGVTCKNDGESCRTNQACCGGACINGAPPGSKPFGICCTPTTCAAQNAECGSLADGCGKTLDCGTCATPATCGGGGVANTCGTSTTSTTITTTTTQSTTTSTTAPTCSQTDMACQTSCTVDTDCPETRFCHNGLCRPRLTDGRACQVYDDCLSGCCCGVASITSCGFIAGTCQDGVNCQGFGEQCPGAPCGQDFDCAGGGTTQFCTAGQCYQKQQNGAECIYASACQSGCCCVASGASVGSCTASGSCGGDSACLP